jgi:hypothetical protein
MLKLRRGPELGECSSSDLAGPSSAPDETLETSATPDGTNELSDGALGERKVLKRSRIKIKSRIRSEDRRPTVDRENMTNEATADREIVRN